MERPDRGLVDDDDATVNPSANPTFREILAARMSRRGFLAGSAAGLAALATGGLGARGAEAQAPVPFTPVVASSDDKLILPPGYTHSVLLRWGDPIFPDAPEFDPQAQTAAKQVRQFGSDNDFIGFMPLPFGSDASTRGLLGVNHENVRPELTWPTWDGKAERTREMCEVEVAAHGFSVVEIARNDRGEWSVVKTSTFNGGSRAPPPWPSGGQRRGTC